MSQQRLNAALEAVAASAASEPLDPFEELGLSAASHWSQLSIRALQPADPARLLPRPILDSTSSAEQLTSEDDTEEYLQSLFGLRPLLDASQTAKAVVLSSSQTRTLSSLRALDRVETQLARLIQVAAQTCALLAEQPDSSADSSLDSVSVDPIEMALFSLTGVYARLLEVGLRVGIGAWRSNSCLLMLCSAPDCAGLC
jgi:hypothetical protein